MALLSVFDSDDIRRVCTRISHEIIERNQGSKNLVLVGLLRRGALFASRLAKNIENIEGNKIDVYSLDFSEARDDKDARHIDEQTSHDKESDYYPALLNNQDNIDFTNSRVIVVDDVLFTGRSVRAALDIISTKSRPLSVQLAVLIDRGHRELPIRADYVGKNLPTKREGEYVLVLMEELDDIDRIDIKREGKA